MATALEDVRLHSSGPDVARAVPQPVLLALVARAGLGRLRSAVRGYAPGRGTGFSTYATPFVVGEMLAVLRGSAPVHVSRTGRDLAASVEVAADAVAAAQGRAPSLGEIAVAADMD